MNRLKTWALRKLANTMQPGQAMNWRGQQLDPTAVAELADPPSPPVQASQSKDLLDALVHQRIAQIRPWAPEERANLADETITWLAVHYPNLDQITRDIPIATMDRIALYAACRAYEPGGVTISGHHWCSAGCHTCHDTGRLDDGQRCPNGCQET